MTNRTTRRKSGKVNLHLPTNIEPLTKKQARMFESHKNIVAHGSAGTGKTFCGLYLALEEVLRKKQYKNITIIRSAVETRKIGFLPGNENDKTEVYEQPYRDLCDELFDDVNAYDKLKLSGVIRFMTTSFIRGTNLIDSVVLVDEYQNMTYHELDSVITRFGGDTRVIFCGDTYQADLGAQSGVKEFNQVLKAMNEFEFIDFSLEDVVRGPLVKSYLTAKYATFGK